MDDARDRRLWLAGVAFALGSAIHLLDHLRRGQGSVTESLYVVGNLAMVLQVVTVRAHPHRPPTGPTGGGRRRAAPGHRVHGRPLAPRVERARATRCGRSARPRGSPTWRPRRRSSPPWPWPPPGRHRARPRPGVLRDGRGVDLRPAGRRGGGRRSGDPCRPPGPADGRPRPGGRRSPRRRRSPAPTPGGTGRRPPRRGVRCSATNAARSSGSSMAAILLANTALTAASGPITAILAVGRAMVASGSKAGPLMA